MNLTKSQKLFLHNVLFGYLAEHPHLDSSDKSSINEIMLMIEEDLFDHKHEEFSDENDHDDETSTTNISSKQLNSFLSLDQFKNLLPLRVTTEKGDRNVLTFFESDGSLCVDLESKGMLVESIFDICCVTRGGSFLRIETQDEDVHQFDVSKFSSDWTKLLPINEPTGLSHDLSD